MSKVDPKKMIFIHGLEGSGQGDKATLLRSLFPGILTPDFRGPLDERQKVLQSILGKKTGWTLIGSSLGGYLAALYAARHPEVLAAVLLAPAFGFARRWPERLGESQMNAWRRNGWMSVYHYGLERMLPLGYGLIDDGLRYEDFPEIHQPVLLIHGTRDDVVTADWSRQYASARPNVELELVDSDHELANVLDWMWDRIRGFLQLG